MSSRSREETWRPEVPDSQSLAPEPLTRRRLPEESKLRVPPESTASEEADQMGTPPE